MENLFLSDNEKHKEVTTQKWTCKAMRHLEFDHKCATCNNSHHLKHYEQTQTFISKVYRESWTLLIQGVSTLHRFPMALQIKYDWLSPSPTLCSSAVEMGVCMTKKVIQTSKSVLLNPENYRIWSSVYKKFLFTRTALNRNIHA